MKNIGTEYEKFAQEIYQTLISNEYIKPIKVQHNIELKGRSGCNHQIDVYWEFEIAGVHNKVAIECKDWKHNVGVGRIRDFFGVITDIGDIKGIFVCKESYQSGAKQFAHYYNIILKELRYPKDNDWDGRIRGFNLKITATDSNDNVIDSIESTISGDEIAKAILKDVNSDSIKFFDNEGNVKDC